MLIRQFFDEFIAHSSYLVAGSNNCVIIDPSRDAGKYIEEAVSRRLKITHILETHLHADFISGHMELASKTGAKIYGPAAAGFVFEHERLSEGSKIELDNFMIKVIETPGHTPEMVNYVCYDAGRSKDDPAAVFSGDTLFVDDLGRPDLFPGRKDELSEKLFLSVNDQIKKLPDHCEVYPAHGAGSLCGGNISSKRTTTIGYEKNNNSLLKIKDLEGFRKELFKDHLPTPDHFKRCSDINRKGPVLLGDLEDLRAVNPREAEDMIKNRDIGICDIRSYDSFGGQHIPGSLNIDFDGLIGNYAGWMLSPEKELLIVPESPVQAVKAFSVLRSAGLDQKIYYLNKGMDSWAFNGLETMHIPQVTPKGLKRIMEEINPVILDVRNVFEYEKGHMKGAVNIPVHQLRERYGEIDRERGLVIYCGSGKRSSLGASILEKKGFSRVFNLAGGFNGLKASGEAIS